MQNRIEVRVLDARRGPATIKMPLANAFELFNHLADIAKHMDRCPIFFHLDFDAAKYEIHFADVKAVDALLLQMAARIADAWEAAADSKDSEATEEQRTEIRGAVSQLRAKLAFNRTLAEI